MVHALAGVAERDSMRHARARSATEGAAKGGGSLLAPSLRPACDRGKKAMLHDHAKHGDHGAKKAKKNRKKTKLEKRLHARY